MAARQQSLGEEIANSVSHGVAFLAAIAGVVYLSTATRHVDAAAAVGIGIFAVTMVVLYLTSTLYHALPAGRAKNIILKFDHGAIYLFIAGSYTPFALGAHAGPGGWMLFGLIWLLAVSGATLKAFDRLTHPWLSTGLYLVMGWLVLIAALPHMQSLTLASMQLLVAGGLAYTAGVAFFMVDSRLRYAHAIWHCFVVAGTGCHYFAVLGYLA